MHILYIVPNPPSLVRVRPYNLIRGLCERGHALTIATLWSSEEEREDVERLRADGFEVIAERLPRAQVVRNLLGALPAPAPLQSAFSWQPALAARLRDTIDKGQAFDLVHVEHLRGARYALDLGDGRRRRPAGARQTPGLPVVWDSVDCISYLFEQAAQHSRSAFGRLMTRFELGRTQRYEGRLAGQFARVLVTSRVDKGALERLRAAAPRAGDKDDRHITVLPNGVDLDYFRPTDTPRAPETVLFSGKMSYHANASAALHLVEDIMPRVWAERPGVRVVIAGKDPTPAVRNLKAKAPHIEITGTVADLRPYLRGATVAVSPLLYGAGIQNKVLEAMACGTPVVASRQAVAALEAQDGRDLCVAENEAAFARHILGLLGDPGRAERVGAAGRCYVEQHHDWADIAARLETIYEEARARKLGTDVC